MDEHTMPAAAPAPASPSAPFYVPASPARPAPPQDTPKPKKHYEADSRDRLALFLACGLGTALAGLLLLPFGALPGLGISALTILWYSVVLWYRGRQGRWSRPAVLLFLAVMVLALSFSLWSNSWFRLYNLLGLIALMTVQLFELSGEGARPWYLPSMLLERFCLFLRSLVDRLPACGATVKSFRHRGGRLLSTLVGLLLALPIMGVVLPLLLSADGYFAYVLERSLQRLRELFGEVALEVLLGLLAAPFLFSLLYALRRPKAKAEAVGQSLPKVESMVVSVTLALLDLLYLLFLCVQSAALFGGRAYLERAVGLTYAEYARSGFFQLVAVASINLTLVLLALYLTEEKKRRAVQALCAVMVAMSCVLLISAAYRMSLYVGLFGLSFKRFLTYWGMGILAILFTAAMLKIWRPGFRFFPVAFVVSVTGWLLLNLCNVDYLVARYNIALYQRQAHAVMNLDYLVEDLSYDALWALEDLPEDMPSGVEGYTLGQLVARRRDQARSERADWKTWSLSAELAARG